MLVFPYLDEIVNEEADKRADKLADERAEKLVAELAPMLAEKLAEKLVEKLVARYVVEHTRKTILKLLQIRLGPGPDDIATAVRAIADEATLDGLVELTATCPDWEAFRAGLPA